MSRPTSRQLLSLDEGDVWRRMTEEKEENGEEENMEEGEEEFA